MRHEILGHMGVLRTLSHRYMVDTQTLLTTTDTALDSINSITLFYNYGCWILGHVGFTH